MLVLSTFFQHFVKCCNIVFKCWTTFFSFFRLLPTFSKKSYNIFQKCNNIFKKCWVQHFTNIFPKKSSTFFSQHFLSFFNLHPAATDPPATAMAPDTLHIVTAMPPGTLHIVTAMPPGDQRPAPPRRPPRRRTGVRRDRAGATMVRPCTAAWGRVGQPRWRMRMAAGAQGGGSSGTIAAGRRKRLAGQPSGAQPRAGWRQEEVKEDDG
jgi:hypothetical protein